MRFRVHGRVQGVGFRAFVRGLAHELDVTGYVRNLDDGSVEVVAQGPRAEELRQWCRQGPSMAHVDKLEDLPEESTSHDHFAIQ